MEGNLGRYQDIVAKTAENYLIRKFPGANEVIVRAAAANHLNQLKPVYVKFS